MKLMNAAARTLFVLGLGLVSAAPAMAQQDVITVGTVSTGGNVVFVPVYIRDVSGTPLGIDQPAGSRIQSYSIKVDYVPTPAVQSAVFSRAGITAPLTPTFESKPSSPGSASLLDTFNEATNLIPFTSNAAAPGNLIGTIAVTLSPTATAGTIVTLTLDPVLTQLTDQGGSPATAETVGNMRLILVNGAVNVVASPQSAPMLGTWALALLAVALAAFAIYSRP